MSQIIAIGAVRVVIRTRDEHCPPHVHAENKAERWKARFQFTFLNDDVELSEVVPLRNKPSKAALDRIRVVVISQLDLCRSTGWNFMRTACLENIWVTADKNGHFVICSSKMTGAVQVRSAVYNPVNRVLQMTMVDGATSTSSAWG
jgi:hypothetical protein